MRNQRIDVQTFGWEPAALREANTRLILKVLRDSAQALSRPLLAEKSGLSPVTVGKIVRRLEEVGFVEETDLDRAGGGRPAGLISIRPAAGYVVGVLPRADSIDGVVMDLRGSVVESAHVVIDMVGNGHDLVEQVAIFVEDLIQQSAVERERVLGVGLGMPGHMDVNSGICVDAWALGLSDYEVAGPLEGLLRLPILIDNDANCLGAYEVLFGQSVERARSLVVSVGKGIGMAIIIDDLVYQGASGMAGDFGHSPVLGSDRKCECGRIGCVETYSSDRGVTRNYEEATGRTVSLERILDGADHGDVESAAALAEAGTVLGVALASAVCTLDPSSVALVLADGISRAGDAFLGPLRAVLRSQSGTRPRYPELVVERVGYERWAQGAGSLALNQFFTPGAPGFSPLSHVAV